MGYLCALLLAVGVSCLGTLEQKKEVENWSGLIRKDSLAKLPGRTDVKVKATSFTYGVFADAKSFKAFANAAFPRHGADISLDPARLLAGNIDWEKDTIVYVIRTAPTNYVQFDSWQVSKSGIGALKIRFSAIEPYYPRSVLSRAQDGPQETLPARRHGWMAGFGQHRICEPDRCRIDPQLEAVRAGVLHLPSSLRGAAGDSASRQRALTFRSIQYRGVF